MKDMILRITGMDGIPQKLFSHGNILEAEAMDIDKKLDMLRDRIQKCVCSYYGVLGVEIPLGEPGNEIVLKLEAEILRQISILWHVGICIVKKPMQKLAIIHDSVTADISEVEYDSDTEYNFIGSNHDM